MILTILRMLSLIPSILRLHSDLALENLALRQQPTILKRQLRRPKLQLALDKDAQEPCSVQGAEHGLVVEFPEVGGLHHRYERRAA